MRHPVKLCAAIAYSPAMAPPVAVSRTPERAQPTRSLLHMRRVFTARVLLTLVALVGCSSCGTSSSASSDRTASTPGPSSTPIQANTSGGALQLAANPNGRLSYSTTSLTANAGQVTIDFTNHSPLPHNVTIASTNGKVLGAIPTFNGGLRTLTLEVGPGTYAFYCSVPGHRAAGMQGVLVVK